MPITVASSIAAVWVPDLLMHRVQASIAAHPSTAFRLRESTKSNGGAAGEDALCRACSDCRHTVKHVQEPPAELDGVDLDLDGVCRWMGVTVGLGKQFGAGVET